jgi:hypothetical protein
MNRHLSCFSVPLSSALKSQMQYTGYNGPTIEIKFAITLVHLGEHHVFLQKDEILLHLLAPNRYPLDSTTSETAFSSFNIPRIKYIII